MSKATIFWGIAIPVLGVATFALYRLYKKKNDTSNVTQPKSSIKTTEVSTLSLSDVVQYFRSKDLNPQNDKPFISTDILKYGERFVLPETAENKKLLFLGVYNGSTNEVSDLELIVADALGDDILSILGDEKIVILS